MACSTVPPELQSPLELKMLQIDFFFIIINVFETKLFCRCWYQFRKHPLKHLTVFVFSSASVFPACASGVLRVSPTAIAHLNSVLPTHLLLTSHPSCSIHPFAKLSISFAAGFYQLFCPPIYDLCMFFFKPTIYDLL